MPHNGPLREQTTHRFPYKHHSIRKAEEDAHTFSETNVTPALLIAAALFKRLPDEDQREIMATVNAQMLGRPTQASQALLVMKMQRPMLFGEQWDFMNAVDRLRGDFSRGEGR
ncbi:hypothetical protein FHS31_001205 [Sphingomonas vulcanisoli]|uniref:Uncharacterized protein n=1 Tax=Sphingomonas vulcanisoli TaxID=1658060 RepID=A0ABX0TTX6_9SPHN|nr:hypothetical protein [Sphingomonas vulcanisoli]NIJ07609.1 hypothetical protein [Sphingomonas vulcanisoli]